MEPGQKNTSKNNNANQHEGTDMPATDIARNPNPRANENIPDKEAENASAPSDTTDTVGSEITDGEDA
jgi:hypothetical protein